MPKGYHQLTSDERCQIYTLKKRGDSQSEIARQLNINRSTVCRELARNTGLKGYRYKQAQEKREERRKEASLQPKLKNDKTLSIVLEKLSMQWSPEQISGWLKKNDPLHCVSHETIYKFIWADKQQCGNLYKHLRHNGKRYNKRSSKNAGRGCIPNRIDIAERPAIVEEKNRVGDWELDTIIGKGQTSAIVSMVDRASKLTKLVKVSQKTAKNIEEALLARLGPIKNFVITLTSDNGKEFAYHEQVSEVLDAKFYFATPYHSWERGLNEHTNGLVRQYFPKGSSFDHITEKMLTKVEELLNNRPRKVLGFQTPTELFNKLCYSSKQKVA